jgi:hypothetical protein
MLMAVLTISAGVMLVPPNVAAATPGLSPLRSIVTEHGVVEKARHWRPRRCWRDCRWWRGHRYCRWHCRRPYRRWW